jgi:hypothetical protein
MIRANIGGSIEVDPVLPFVYVTMYSGDGDVKGCLALSPDKVRELTYSLKQARKRVERGEA